MCERLSELKEALSRYAKCFDARLVSVADAAVAVREASAIESMASAIKSLAAARSAEAGTWRASGHRSAAEALARQTGVSAGVARQTIEVGRRLGEHHDVARAALSGELSASQAALVAEAAAADPGSAPRLIAAASETSVCQLRCQVAQTKAASADLEARRRRIHRQRRMRAWTDPEGVWRLSAIGNPEAGALVMAALKPIRDELFDDARRTGRREHPDAYGFDALVRLAEDAAGHDPGEPQRRRRPGDRGDPGQGSRHAGSGSGTSASAERARRRRRQPAAKLIIRVDYDTWLRGAPLAGETCELVGYGPICLSAVHDLVERADPIVAAVMTKGKSIVGVAHAGRRPNAYQQTALEWLYPSCANLACSVHVRLERDHRIEWSKTHYTMFDNMDLLCEHDHWLKTHRGWALIEGSGKRPFVPPGDPRHPRYKPPP